MGVVLLAPKTNIYTVTVATARGTEFLRGSVYLSFQHNDHRYLQLPSGTLACVP